MKEYYTFKSDDKLQQISQVMVSNECFSAIVIMEVTYRKAREMLSVFRSADAIQHLVESVMYVWEGRSIPDCHKICEKNLYSYIRARTDQYGKQMRARNSVRESRS